MTSNQGQRQAIQRKLLAGWMRMPGAAENWLNRWFFSAFFSILLLKEHHLSAQFRSVGFFSSTTGATGLVNSFNCHLKNSTSVSTSSTSATSSLKVRRALFDAWHHSVITAFRCWNATMTNKKKLRAKTPRKPSTCESRAKRGEGDDSANWNGKKENAFEIITWYYLKQKYIENHCEIYIISISIYIYYIYITWCLSHHIVIISPLLTRFFASGLSGVPNQVREVAVGSNELRRHPGGANPWPFRCHDPNMVMVTI